MANINGDWTETPDQACWVKDYVRATGRIWHKSGEKSWHAVLHHKWRMRDRPETNDLGRFSSLESARKALDEAHSKS